MELMACLARSFSEDVWDVCKRGVRVRGIEGGDEGDKGVGMCRWLLEAVGSAHCALVEVLLGAS